MLETRNTKDFYKSVKVFKSKQELPPWNIVSMFPELTNEEIAEESATFFNRISKEYVPILDPSRIGDNQCHIQPYQVAQRLRSFKKPKSQVVGDINPVLVGEFHDLLAEPLSFIYNQVLNTLAWPKIWKHETVSLIPKNNSPSSLSELRNLSCTPLFSKVLESFILDKLREEIKLSCKQYGGLKGCSTQHFLVDSWDHILRALEDGDTAANLISVDFEKAFNRMDHSQCLASLDRLGAAPESIEWVAAFLYGRQMSVKVNGVFSEPKDVPGGSPQGSILGNFLFCVTTNQFTEIDSPEIQNISNNSSSSDGTIADGPAQVGSITPWAANSSTPTERGQFANFVPPTCLLDLSGEYVSDEESFRFFRARGRLSFDSSSSDDHSDNLSYIRPPTITNTPIESLVYIDDFNCIEKIRITEARSHLTTNKKKVYARAQKSEAMFTAIESLAKEIGMRVNANKTQLLCIHASKFSEVTSYIGTETREIASSDKLKLLGFNFDRTPDASFHVGLLIEKFYARLWTLRFLKKSGMAIPSLMLVYKSIIRPFVEYCAVIYHTLIPEYQSNKLESVQRLALRIIYGSNQNLDQLFENGTIERLSDRRVEICLKFALRAEKSERFGPNWFKLSPGTGTQVRDSTRRKYIETFSRTERMRNNPVNYLTRILNKHYSS